MSVSEIHVQSPVDIIPGERRLALLKDRGAATDFRDVARKAGPEPFGTELCTLLRHVLFGFHSARDAFLLKYPLDQTLEQIHAERIDLDLFLQTAHERVLGHVAQGQIGCNYPQSLELNLETHPRP